MVLAEALAAKPNLRAEAFNFSNEIQVTVLELVERLLELMNSKLKPEIRNEATNEIRHQYLSAAKARETLGWQPLFSLDEGLRRTIDWYKTFLGITQA
jgi:CDP-glucose 4,6-dehydratase